jgi:uncharacterized delta-60 repeat protein
MTLARRLVVLALTTLAAAPQAAALPHAGAIDRDFGHRGRLTLSLPGERLKPSAMAVQPDGKIVVAGTLVGAPGTYPGAVAGDAVAIRFLEDGELDPGFGVGGIARVHFADPVDIQGLAFQPDAAVLLSGVSVDSDAGRRNGAVARLLPSGRVDESFGSSGLAALRDAGYSGRVTDVFTLTQMAVQPDGRIVAAGSQDAYDVHSIADPYVARLLPDGMLDPSFGGDGRGSNGTANPVAALTRPGGDVVVVGWDPEYFGGSYLTLLEITPGATDLPLPHSPSPAWAAHRYRNSFQAVAAQLREDGSIDVVGDLRSFRRSQSFLARARVGPDLQLLERGKVRSASILGATFDARGALLTAGPWEDPFGVPPFTMHRYRDMRLLDRSFGDRHGKRYVYAERPANLVGLAAQGDKLILAAASYPASGRANYAQSITLVRLHARQDIAAPRLRIEGLPRRRCLTGAKTALVVARDESRVTTRVRLDSRHLATSTRHRFRLDLDAGALSPGRHKLRIRSVDAAHNLGARSWTIRACGR